MLKRHFFLLILLFPAFFSACTADKKRTAKELFDSQSYFSQEVQRHQQAKTRIQKELRIDGEVDKLTLDSLDWASELALFMRSNINKPALVDEYQIDSVMQQGRLTEVHYETQNSELKTRKLSVYYEKDSLQRIEIFNKTSNSVYGAEQYLKYQPNRGYEMRDTQEVQIVGANVFAVKARFL